MSGRRLVWVCCALMACAVSYGEERTESDVVVSAESDDAEHDQFTEPGEYAQPAWAERNRLSSTTSVYVLSPYEMFGGILWEGDFRRQGKSMHDLIQEIDLGLPHRLEFGFENELGLIGGDAHATSGTVEARYAFTNWNVVPLNPAISAEYIFGWGKSVRSASHDSNRHGNALREQPDAVALRLLLGQDFAGRIGYGFNLSLTQDVTRDSGREIGLSQSITYGAMKGKLEFGAEMRYTHSTERLSLGTEDELVCGPTIGWKPTRQIRVSFAPLFGATSESARVSTFLLISYEFGGAEAIVPSVSTLER